jgi:DNA (cytosine-5)-methyltransferase 1
LNVAAVDLFCGIGGLTHGLIKAGIPVVAGIDIDETCRYAYETNNQSTFICKDISRELTGADLKALYPEGCIKVLVGCAPCTPFSPHTQKNKKRAKGENWKLLYSFSRLIAEVKPEIVSMENVYEISRTKVFRDFVEKLNSLGYHVSWSRVYCPDYGVSQTRRRLVLLASKLGEIGIIPPTHSKQEYRTVEDVIGNLEPIAAGEIAAKDLLHRSSKLNEVNMKRIRQSKPGGTWRDWDEELLAPCHKKKTGKSYSGVYARMVADDVGPTITTQFYNYGTGRFGHPEQNRALSLREGALLQTFPSDYDFIDPELPFSMKRLGVHIGNAVPVDLGVAIGRSIISHLGGVSNGWENGEK